MKNYIFVIAITVLIFGCNSSIVDDPSTTIKFSVAETAHVKLYVENSYDTIVTTLVDQVLAAGNYSVSFDTNNLAEGIYFYTLELKGESGSYSKTTKNMMLIK
jgi:hypothetical protein